MNEAKFKSILDRNAGLSAEQYAKAYPQLTDEQITILTTTTTTTGEAYEPSRKSLFSFTKADK
jgi:uncharacterized membrane protein YgcG